MMKQFISHLALLAVLLCSTMGSSARAQGFCGVASTPDPDLESLTLRLPQQENYVMRVRLFIVRNSDGTGGASLGQAYYALEQSKLALEPHGICLSLNGIFALDDTYYATQFSSTKFAQLQSQYDAPDAVEIFVLPAQSWNQAQAGGIPTTFVVIPGQFLGSSQSPSRVMAHELGHCFGLYHTFQGLPGTGGGCVEYVNGSNCNSCGDWVCDTPADPLITESTVTTNCVYTGSAVDPLGMPYQPSTTNVMSYTREACMQDFTAMQGLRMRYFIGANPVLQPATVPDTGFVQNVSITDAYTYHWINQDQTVLGHSVTVTLPQGPVVYAGSGAFYVSAGYCVRIMPGFHATASNGGRFIAMLDSNVCSVIDVYNSAREEDPPIANEITSAEPLVTAFPNPVRDHMTLRWGHALQERTEIRVYSIQGQQMPISIVRDEGDGPRFELTFSVLDLPAGIYLWRLQLAGQTCTGKFIKQ